MRTIFTKCEIKYIKENYTNTDTTVLAKKLGKTANQIKNKAQALGVKKKPRVSEYQKDYIKKHYHNMKNTDIAKKISLNTTTIQQFANRNGLYKAFDVKRIFSEKDEQYILDNYSKLTTQKIADDLNVTKQQVSNKVNNMDTRIVQFDLDIDLPNIKDMNNLLKDKLDNDFFEIIDTEDKAYWLGFLYADGYVYTRKNNGSKRLELCLSDKDYSHIKKFKKCIGSQQKIKEKKIYNKKLDKTYFASKIVINGKTFVTNLEEKGCVQAKSLILEFPTSQIIPDELLKHFIRGYFDGDGCVFTKGDSNIVNFVGTKEFLMGIQEHLNTKIGLTKTALYQKGNAYQFSYSGFNNCMFFFKYIYDGSSIFLDRKYEKFIEMAKKSA